MKPEKSGLPRGIPHTVRSRAAEVIELTDAFCAEHLDAEYAALCRALVVKLARKRQSPLARGEARVWAGAAIYTMGRNNFLFDPSQSPHLTTDEVSRLTGVAKSTLARRAAEIEDLLRISPFQPGFCRRALIAANPMAWTISVNGFLVDARTLPPQVQAELAEAGLIPRVEPSPTPDA
jgi:hypothetical protein